MDSWFLNMSFTKLNKAILVYLSIMYATAGAAVLLRGSDEIALWVIFVIEARLLWKVIRLSVALEAEPG